jgi:hypothetical protein
MRAARCPATSTALVPLRLANRQMVTAGRNSFDAGVHHANVFGGLLAAIGHLRHVAHEHRLVARHSHHHVAHVFGGAQELAGFEQVFAIAARNLPEGQAAVGKPQRARHLQRREVVGRQLGLIEHDADLAALPADQGHGGDVGHLLDGVVELGGDAAQLEIAVAAAGEASAPGSARRRWSAASPAAAKRPAGSGRSWPAASGSGGRCSSLRPGPRRSARWPGHARAEVE